jgi:hypothetical protein
MFCANCGKEIPNISNFCKHCGNKVRKVENEIQTPKTVKVIFHRTKRFLACAVPLDVHVDNKLVGSLNNNGTFEMDIPCGTHEIILEMWSCVNKQQVTFSEEYSKVYLDIKIKMGLLTNKPEIISIRNEK